MAKDEDMGGYSAYGGSSAAVSRSNTMASSTGASMDRLRRDYEFKIATMQNKISTLEQELATAKEVGHMNVSSIEKLKPCPIGSFTL